MLSNGQGTARSSMGCSEQREGANQQQTATDRPAGTLRSTCTCSAQTAQPQPQNGSSTWNRTRKASVSLGTPLSMSFRLNAPSATNTPGHTRTHMHLLNIVSPQGPCFCVAGSCVTWVASWAMDMVSSSICSRQRHVDGGWTRGYYDGKARQVSLQVTTDICCMAKACLMVNRQLSSTRHQQSHPYN